MKTIKNLRLISETDPIYRAYQSSFRKNDLIIRNSEKPKSEMIAYVLEITVREWLKKSDLNLTDRIITYERFDYKTPKVINLFDEIDYAIKNKNEITIGEIKTSFHENRLKAKATEQLKQKGEYLKEIGYKVRYQMIFFDLCYSHSKSVLNKFDTDFRKVNFSLFEHDGVEIEYLHLNPLEIYEWGVKENIIKTPELLDAALKEAEKRYYCMEAKWINRNYKPKELPISIGNFSKSTQGLCVKSETPPIEKDIKKIILSIENTNLETDTIIIARFNWLKRNKFVIPDSKKLMNLCIQIQKKTVRRAFYSDNMNNLTKKLNYNILILN